MPVMLKNNVNNFKERVLVFSRVPRVRLFSSEDVNRANFRNAVGLRKEYN